MLSACVHFDIMTALTHIMRPDLWKAQADEVPQSRSLEATWCNRERLSASLCTTMSLERRSAAGKRRSREIERRRECRDAA